MVKMNYRTARAILAEAIEQLDEDVYGDIESAKIARRRVRRARPTSYYPPDHPARKAEADAEAMHKKMGSSDKIYTYDKPTKKFKVTGRLPKGAAQAAASQGNRLFKNNPEQNPNAMTKKHEKALLKASRKSGGIVASPKWTDPAIDPLHRDVVVGKRKDKSGRITKRSQNARDYNR